MLSNKAMLVTLNVSQWTGKKQDKRATHTVETEHGTDTKVGNYTKKLLPGAKELDKVNALSQQIRLFVYEQTLPWCSDGTRILSSKNYMDFVAEFRKHKDAFDSAVMKFLSEYPSLKASARMRLGDLYREMDYPTTETLQENFQCDVSFMPVPHENDFRVEILDSEKQAFMERMRKVEADAMLDVWKRLHEVVSKAAAKLNDPKALFKDSLIENIHEMCALLPKLNVTDDPSLEAMRQQVETAAAKIMPDVCRESGIQRVEAAKDLNDIVSKMSAFMGN